jgi:hypothetical protein
MVGSAHPTGCFKTLQQKDLAFRENYSAFGGNNSAL